MGPGHILFSGGGQVDFYNWCVFETGAPNTSRYPVSGRLFLHTSGCVFFLSGPRTRPAILCRAGYGRGRVRDVYNIDD